MYYTTPFINCQQFFWHIFCNTSWCATRSIFIQLRLHHIVLQKICSKKKKVGIFSVMSRCAVSKYPYIPSTARLTLRKICSKKELRRIFCNTSWCATCNIFIQLRLYHIVFQKICSKIVLHFALCVLHLFIHHILRFAVKICKHIFAEYIHKSLSCFKACPSNVRCDKTVFCCK